MNQIIAVVDDEPDIVELITLHLKKAGFHAQGFFEAKSFIDSLEKWIPELIILDLMLPDVDGLEVCNLLRRNEKWASIPVIMVTAKGEESDKILGLELGADDYITKPFSAWELVVRVNSVLRRKSGPAASRKSEVDDLLVLDLEKYEVLVQDKKVDLTSTESRILKFLASKPDWIFRRDRILDDFWGHEKIVLDQTIDVRIRNPRENMGPGPAGMIKNIRGVGDKLEP